MKIAFLLFFTLTLYSLPVKANVALNCKNLQYVCRTLDHPSKETWNWTSPQPTFCQLEGINCVCPSIERGAAGQACLAQYHECKNKECELCLRDYELNKVFDCRPIPRFGPAGISG